MLHQHYVAVVDLQGAEVGSSRTIGKRRQPRSQGEYCGSDLVAVLLGPLPCTYTSEPPLSRQPVATSRWAGASGVAQVCLGWPRSQHARNTAGCTGQTVQPYRRRTKVVIC